MEDGMVGEMGNEPAPTRLYRKRWTFIVLVIVAGSQVGFSAVDLGAWSDYIADTFDVTHQTVDIVIILATVGSVVSALPIALVSRKYANYVKHLLISGYLTFGIAFLIQAIVFFKNLPIAILGVGNFFAGVATSLFYACAPLVATAWFAEREQATFFGTIWFSIGLGKLIGSSVPTMTEAFPMAVPGSALGNGIKTSLATFATLDIITCLLIVFFFPNLPTLPPSMAESQRLFIAQDSKSKPWKQIIAEFASELKVFFTDKTTVVLILTFGTYISLTMVQFMMMPVAMRPLPEDQNVTSVLHNASSSLEGNATGIFRSQALMAISIGALLGSIPAGLLLDKAKSYNPMASLISTSILISAILIFLGVYFEKFILLFIACTLYGLTSFAANCFFTEIIKQYIYPLVFETNFGLILGNSLSLLLLIYSPVLRQILIHFGALGYYITFCIILMCAEIATICVKPDLKRFLYESEQTCLLNDS